MDDIVMPERVLERERERKAESAIGLKAEEIRGTDGTDSASN